MTGFRRRTDALVHTVLVNAGLVPIPLFINAPDPQGAFAATLPLVKYVRLIIQAAGEIATPGCDILHARILPKKISLLNMILAFS